MRDFDTYSNAPPPQAATSPQGDTARLTVQEIAQALRTGLGQALVAVIINCDVTTLSRCASGAEDPPLAQDRMVRIANQVFEVVAQADSPAVARAWFMGMNPALDDRTPAETIAEGDVREVMAAARGFAAGN